MHKALWGHEEWLVCAHSSAPGRIVGGAGKTLRDICPSFPLLIKKICADQRLSVQVHPNDETAKTVGGEPKTEMWCVLKPGPIFAGFRPGVTNQDVGRAVANDTLEELLVRFDAKAGECYFIPGGLVHAIGEGTSVYEVQQSSDTTFRLYDWERVGADGKPRQLQVKEGHAAMDVTLPPPVPSDSVKCKYFEFGKVQSDLRLSASILQPSAWRVVYDPAADDCVLLPPGGTGAVAPGAFITRILNV